MEDIFLRKIIDVEKIKAVLEELFPELTVFYYDFNNKKPKKLDLENPKHIFFHIINHYTDKAFDYEIRIYRTNSIEERARALFIAQKLSADYSISTMVQYVYIGADNPVCKVIFEDNKTYIVEPDNANIANADDDIDKVKKEFVINLLKFDAGADSIYPTVS